MATTAEVQELLDSTSLPPDLIDRLLAQLPPAWLMADAKAVAGDLLLCHPRLSTHEVRAMAASTAQPDVWRLTVAAHHRPGLLAGLATVLAGQGLSISDASVWVLPERAIALHRVAAARTGDREGGPAWDIVGEDLRAVLGRQQPGSESTVSSFRPASPVTVEAQPQGFGRAVITVRAPHQAGLLAAVATWLGHHGCHIEAYRSRLDREMADSVLLVKGEVDSASLATAISGPAAPGEISAGGPAPGHARRCDRVGSGVGESLSIGPEPSAGTQPNGRGEGRLSERKDRTSAPAGNNRTRFARKR